MIDPTITAKIEFYHAAGNVAAALMVFAFFLLLFALYYRAAR